MDKLPYIITKCGKSSVSSEDVPVMHVDKPNKDEILFFINGLYSQEY